MRTRRRRSERKKGQTHGNSTLQQQQQPIVPATGHQVTKRNLHIFLTVLPQSILPIDTTVKYSTGKVQKKQLNDSSDRFSSTSAKTFRQNTVTHTKHIKTSGLQASLLLLSAQHVEHSSSSQPKDYIWPYKAVQQTTIRYDYRHLLGPVHAACCRRNRPPSSAVALGGVRVVLV